MFEKHGKSLVKYLEKQGKYLKSVCIILSLVVLERRFENYMSHSKLDLYSNP